MKKIECNNFIVKSNHLIEAKYRLTSVEQKIIFMVTKSINKDDQDFKQYSFKISELIDLMDIKGRNKYTQIKDITRKLMKKVFTIYDRELNKETQISWFSSVDYLNGAGIVTFEFSPKLKPFLLQLKECFTQIDIKQVMHLKSSYSIRVYELIKQYEKVGERQFTLDDLRYKLGIEKDEYSLYANFKKNVILQSQKEINEKTDLNFDFEEIKLSRKKVNSIRFIINPKTSSTETKKFEETPKNKFNFTSEHIEEIKSKFKNLYKGTLIDKFVEEMLEKKGIEHLRKCVNEYKEHLEGRNISNVSGDFYTYVIKGYEKPFKHKGNVPTYADFDQREYTEKDFEPFYSNLNKD